MSSALNSVDYFFIFVFGISILLGFARGLLREIISLATWIGAAVVSSLFSHKLASAFGSSAATVTESASTGNYNDLAALGVSFVVLFIGTLFVGYLLNLLVSGIIQGTFISFPNRLLGALFGGLRGFIIVIVLMFIAELTPMGDQPAWKQSQMVNAFAPAVKWLQDFVQPGLDVIRTKAQDAIQKIKENAPSTGSFQNIIGGEGSSNTSNP